MSKLKILLFAQLIAFYVCNHTNIHWITCIISYSNYILYTYLYYLSFNNIYFAEAITPINYIEPIHGSHKLVSYGFSTLHALFISVCATLYLLNIIDNYDIKQAYFISISYYSADIYYVIDSVKKLTKNDYFTLCHHIVMIVITGLGHAGANQAGASTMNDGSRNKLYQFCFGLITVNVRLHKLIKHFREMFGARATINA